MMEEREEQDKKTAYPISVTVLGIKTVVMVEHPLKA